MRGSWIAAVLCFALAGALPAAAQQRPGVTTIMLPHNLARSQELAHEAHRHDRAIAHIHQNMRARELGHKRTLENIRKDDRLSGEAKARRIADETQRFDIDMRGLERQLAIAEQEHARNKARVRARRPEPGEKAEISDRFNAETAPLDRARAVANEDIRYERALAHIDENKRRREETHRQRLKNIENDGRLPADAKGMERAEEDELFEVDLRYLERHRKIAEEDHANRRAAIDARYGNPNPGADVFAAQDDPTPPAKPGPAQADNSPIEGGISGSRQGGKAVTGPTGRPPLKIGTDQTGTGGVGPPSSRPPVLKGSVEENVGFPPQPATEAPQQPCSKEWAFGTPDAEHQFVEGMSASIARCVEADWAITPVAGPLAYAASKERMVALVLTAITRTMGAAALYKDLQKQRPGGECAYDTGLWYAQLLCDARLLAAKAPDDPSFGGRQRGGLDPVRPVRPPLQTGEAPRPVSQPGPDPYQAKGQTAREPEAPGAVCSAVKQDCFWRAMRNATGDAAFEQRFAGPRPRSWPEVYQVLKRNFGNKVPDASSPSHDNGIPVPMSYDQIVDYLKDKEGAEGIVFVFYANGESHAFNVANFKRRVVFMDDQKQFWQGDAPRQTVEAALRGKVAHSLFYRTR